MRSQPEGSTGSWDWGMQTASNMEMPHSLQSTQASGSNFRSQEGFALPCSCKADAAQKPEAGNLSGVTREVPRATSQLGPKMVCGAEPTLGGIVFRRGRGLHMRRHSKCTPLRPHPA